MNRVYAALERDPDVDVETVLSDALDADGGFRAMLAQFAERASDAVVFMATSGGPGTALAVDDLLLEGAVRLHEAATAALEGCGRDLWGPLASLIVRDLSPSALSALLMMRADARFSKALAELTLAAMATATASCDSSGSSTACDGTVARREHALVVRCEFAVPAEPCPDGRTVVVSDAESLPLMVPGRRVELRIIARPDKDPACGPAYTAACGRKLVAAIAASARLDAVDFEQGFIVNHHRGRRGFLETVDTRSVIGSHIPDLRGPIDDDRRWWPLGAAWVRPIAFVWGQRAAHGSMCPQCWSSVPDGERHAADLLVLVASISGGRSLPLDDSVFFRAGDEKPDAEILADDPPFWSRPTSINPLSIAMRDAVSDAMRRSAHVLLRHLVCCSTPKDHFDGHSNSNACWKTVAMHMDAASSRALLRELLGSRDIAGVQPSP